MIRVEILLCHALYIRRRDLLDSLRKSDVQGPIADADPFAEFAGDGGGAIALVRILGNVLLLDAGDFRGVTPPVLILSNSPISAFSTCSCVIPGVSAAYIVCSDRS